MPQSRWDCESISGVYCHRLPNVAPPSSEQRWALSRSAVGAEITPRPTNPESTAPKIETWDVWVAGIRPLSGESRTSWSVRDALGGKASRLPETFSCLGCSRSLAEGFLPRRGSGSQPRVAPMQSGQPWETRQQPAPQPQRGCGASDLFPIVAPPASKKKPRPPKRPGLPELSRRDLTHLYLLFSSDFSFVSTCGARAFKTLESR